MTKFTHAVTLSALIGTLAAAAALATQPCEKSAPHAAPDAKPRHTMHEPPVAVHAAWGKLTGDYTSSVRLSFPGAQAQAPTAGKAKVSMLLGGRFLVVDEDGTMMGQPFQSHKMYGYNVGADAYEGVWTFTGSTAIMTLTGKSTDGGKTIAYEATHRNSPTGGEAFVITLTRVSDDSFTVTMTSKNPDGSDGGRVESVYTRAKQP